MRLKQTIFLDEEKGTEHDHHPAYILADEMTDGKLRIQVREKGHGGNKGAEIFITREQMANIASSFLKFLGTGSAI